jgi:hypothetical protein
LNSEIINDEIKLKEIVLDNVKQLKKDIINKKYKKSILDEYSRIFQTYLSYISIKLTLHTTQVLKKRVILYKNTNKNSYYTS